MKPLLFVIGAALIAGAESHTGLGRMLVQSACGLGLILLALRQPTDNEVN